MKFELTSQQIASIADFLEAGFTCYVHKHTKELIEIPDLDGYSDFDMDNVWKEDLEKISANRNDYFVFKPMGSNSSFQVMREFVDSLSSSKLKEKLTDILHRSKPFRNFKFEIDNSGEFRDKWFDFRRARYIDWVTERIQDENLYEAD